MTRRQLPVRPLFAMLAALLLAACGNSTLDIRPVGSSYAGAQMAAEREDADYASARAAIERRDYAEALEWLQSARTRNPSDVRVLNAFGVVYDKLGRFDLSTRYYHQALELDHGSTVVAHNLAYSRSLQARIVSSPSTWELADIKPPSALSAEPAAPVALAVASGRPYRGLTIVNATGQAKGEQPVFARLLGLKWALNGRRPVSGAPTTTSLIRYTPKYRTTAVALSRTLPRGVQMVEAEDDQSLPGGGLMLVLGMDSRKWPSTFANRS